MEYKTSEICGFEKKTVKGFQSESNRMASGRN